MSEQRSWWDRMQVIALLATPVVLALIGTFGSFSNQRTPRMTVMVDHAMQVLQRQPTEEQRGLRSWAVQLIESESGIPFDKDTRRKLVDSIRFPHLSPTDESGAIAGIITDARSNEPLVGVTVLLVGESIGSSTNENGEYRMIYVPIGTHKLNISVAGYAPLEVDNVEVLEDLTTYQNHSLSDR